MQWEIGSIEGDQAATGSVADVSGYAEVPAAQMPLVDPDQLPLKINRSIGLEARKRGLDRPFFLHCVLKAVVNPNKGYMEWEDVKGIAPVLGIPLHSLYRWAKGGEGVFFGWFDKVDSLGRPVRLLQLKGPGAIMDALDLEYIAQHYHVVTLGQVRGVQRFRAAIYSTQFTGIGQDAHPYSRDKFAEDQGISRRSQIRYSQVRQVDSHRRITHRIANFVPDELVPYEGKRKLYMMTRRLPNSTMTTLPCRGWGQAKVANGHGSRPSKSCSTLRRYFDTAKGLVKCKGSKDSEVFLAVTPRRARQRGRWEWEHAEVLPEGIGG